MLNEGFAEKLLQKVTNSLKKANRKRFAKSVQQIKKNPKVKDALADFIKSYDKLEKTTRSNMSDAEYDRIMKTLP
jgi:DNA-binding ferritin-like protein